MNVVASAEMHRTRFVVGDVLVRLELERSLSALWDVPDVPGVSAMPELLVSLQESDEINAQVRWFGEGAATNDELVGRGCRLVRHLSKRPAHVTGTCLPTRTAVRHALRFATQPALLERGWLLLHAAALERPEGLHVFVGASGVGKSSLVAAGTRRGLCAHAEEVTVVKAGLGAGHPVDPVSMGSKPIRVAAFHFLEKGMPKVTAISSAQACARLLSFAMVYERSRAAEEAAFEAAELIARTTRADVVRSPDATTTLASLGWAHP